jgi:hypothetical protein
VKRAVPEPVLVLLSGIVILITSAHGHTSKDGKAPGIKFDEYTKENVEFQVGKDSKVAVYAQAACGWPASRANKVKEWLKSSCGGKGATVTLPAGNRCEKPPGGRVGVDQHDERHAVL